MRARKDILFSVVIPCFNEEKYIKKLLLSLEKQDIGSCSFEVVVVDNNSTDKTSQVIWDYAASTALNIQMVHEYTAGVSVARNSGSKIASGEVIVFLDADNTLKENFLARLENYISREQCLAGTICTLPDNRNMRGWILFLFMEFIKTVSPRPFGKSFVDRQVLSSSRGFNESIVLGENVEFLINIKKIVTSMGGMFGQIRPGIRCSLRRFEKVGYIGVLLPWLRAYIGNYTIKYKTMTEIDNR